MTDKLKMDYINSLPHPLLVRFYGAAEYWPLEDIDVETGLLRIDVCGKLQISRISEVGDFVDDHQTKHDPDSFYCEEP